jgi:hypothetical protein
MAKLIVELDDDIKLRFAVKCKQQGKTQKQIIIGLIQKFLKSTGGA